jgi:glycosyltransferase involved in cell wall biosynthesis
MVPKKGPLLTVEAFARAVETCPNLRLDLVGDGPLFGAAVDLVDALRLGGRVIFHGSLPNDDVLDLMERADVFLQHSLTDPATGDEEGLPVAILEAMSRSLPVVATRHAGIPEAVVDGATGLLVDEGDVATMAERIAYLYGEPVVRQAMGRRGWAWALEHFSWARERAALLELLGLDDVDATW